MATELIPSSLIKLMRHAPHSIRLSARKSSQELPKGTNWSRRFASGVFDQPIGKIALAQKAGKSSYNSNGSGYFLDSLVKSPSG